MDFMCSLCKRPGEIGYCTGVNSASLDTFIVRIKGKGGHSSQPQLCVDPVMISNQVYQAVNLLVTREVDPSAMATLTCGVIKGGTAVNIIPDYCRTSYRRQNAGCKGLRAFAEKDSRDD